MRFAAARDGLSHTLPSARNLVIAGAGIGGLTAALSLARIGARVSVFEQAERLEETGAGVQLTPNATRVLTELGLAERLAVSAVTPDAIRVLSAAWGREIVRIPLGREVEKQYGAPYWVIHRGDLQLALADAARNHIDIDVSLGTRIEDFVAHSNGVTVQARRAGQVIDERAIALIGADGLWSSVRARMRRDTPPRFRYRTAWRALVPAHEVAEEWRAPLINLWLGRDAHLVHYPVKGGALINIVAIADDTWQSHSWNAASDREDVLRRFGRFDWTETARTLLAVPEQWHKWALHDRPAPMRSGKGAVTLLGDAAHPMLPFLAQGAAMAIEDGAVLAAQFAEHFERPSKALRRYEKLRRRRTSRAMRAARKQGNVYGRSGPEALLRNMAMRLLGGERLLRRYNWLYKWQPPVVEAVPAPPTTVEA